MRPQARFATIAFVPIRRGGGPKTHALAGGIGRKQVTHRVKVWNYEIAAFWPRGPGLRYKRTHESND